MNDENLTKQFYQLIAKDGKDTLYLGIDRPSNEVIVTKVRPVVTAAENNLYYLQFRSINDETNQYEVLMGTLDENADYEDFYASYKLSYNQDGEAIAVPSSQASAFVYDLVDNSTDIYKNFGFEGSTKVIISLNGDAESKVTKIGPFATVKRTGLDETVDADYSLIMDTAYVDHKDNIRYAYYITKPIVAADTAWNAEKFYMVSYTDSVAAHAAELKNEFLHEGQYTKLGFVDAVHRVDSVFVPTMSEENKKTVITEGAILPYTFAFRIVNPETQSFYIEAAKLNDEKNPNSGYKSSWMAWINGCPVLTDDITLAEEFNVREGKQAPTANETIEDAASTISVVATDGAVIVKGAEGKNVIVSTILGKVVANETVTSDNVTIAAPAGIVVVSVDGESFKVAVK